ncbi:von Willebrand factor type a [Plakobranchus ocellatus]|uniref:von Willebrand factor type a n=1 Tax=Plakobranchus ocellatus TaxID=259542 RepID=A0AAV3Z926_9GAST|nr:von Willebrand factor type a [Plakobranchus ocellatus]
MKRCAQEETGSENPAKVSKGAKNDEASTLARADTVIRQPDGSEPSRSRQRKAPSWLASYVTGGSAKDLAKAAAELPAKKPTKKKVDNEDSKEKTLKKLKTKSIKVEKGSIEPKVFSDDTLNNKLDSSLSSSSSSNLSLSKLPSVASSKSASPNSSFKKVSIISSKSSTLLSSIKSGLTNDDSVLEVCEGTDVVSSSSSLNLKNTTAASSSSVSSKISSPILQEASGSKLENGSAKVGKISTFEDTTMNKDGLFTSTKKGETPTMLEVVICVSTSGAMREYLAELQSKAREMVWRLQSLIPDLRIGVFAHTQGGIHDDKRAGSSCSVANIDHNYIRTGGHSGTKWLDLGASFSQICAFINSLEPESVVYPDYVQDNLEMALWKLQRCMSWSSCSYRTVVMLGRGRPNSTTFYLQREHWRGWIRSALELGPRQEVPVIDWRLEARLLAQMGIHVFTLQAVTDKRVPGEEEEEEEEEGTIFFRETAASTNGQHFRLKDVSCLEDIIVGVCCACYGPDLLQEYRDELRDQNDGVVPANLKDIFVSLGLHSNRRSLKTIPSLVGDLQALQSKIKAADMSNGRLLSTSEEEGGMSSEGEDSFIKNSPVEVKTEVEGSKKAGKKPKLEKQQTKQSAATKAAMKKEKDKKPIKNGRVEKKSSKVVENRKAVNILKKVKPEKAVTVEAKSTQNNPDKKTVSSSGVNNKKTPIVKAVQKVGRPRSVAKPTTAAKKKVASNKPVVNNPRAKSMNSDSKESKKIPVEMKPNNNDNKKQFPKNQDIKTEKAPRGRPKGKKSTSLPLKQSVRNSRKMLGGTDTQVKKSQADTGKKNSGTSVVDKKNSVSKGKTQTKGPVVDKTRKLVNGKQKQSNGSKFVKGRVTSKRSLGQVSRNKAATAVTRGSLKNKK